MQVDISDSLKLHFQTVDTIPVEWNANTKSAARPTTILKPPKVTNTTKEIVFRGENGVKNEAATMPLLTHFFKRKGGARCTRTLRYQVLQSSMTVSPLGPRSYTHRVHTQPTPRLTTPPDRSPWCPPPSFSPTSNIPVTTLL